MRPELSDAAHDPGELWRRCLAADGGAREELTRLAHAIAERELARRGARPSDRADLAQEAVRSTLACLASGADAPRDLGAFLKFRAWGVLSDFRKRMRTQAAEIEDAGQVAGRDAGPDRGLRAAELREALDDCRAKLNAEQRETLRMRYDLGLEADDAAARMRSNRNTVHVRVFRALAALRDCMRRKGFDAEELR